MGNAQGNSGWTVDSTTALARGAAANVRSRGGRSRWLAVAGLLAFVVGAMGTARTAWATVPFAGTNEISEHIFFQAGLNSNTPGGFKFFNEYGFRLSNETWFNAQVNFVFGDSRDCVVLRGDVVCNGRGSFSGNTLEMAAGVKIKFNRMRVPLVPYVKAGGAVEFVFFGNGVNAYALAARGGGGVKYFITPAFGVGGELLLTVGPMFGDVSGAYVAVDFAGGVEFLF